MFLEHVFDDHLLQERDETGVFLRDVSVADLLGAPGMKEEEEEEIVLFCLILSTFSCT